jgi:nuclear control of ATPase protein 2
LQGASAQRSSTQSDSLETKAADVESRSSLRLKAVVRALSTTSGSHPLLPRKRLRHLVRSIAHVQEQRGQSSTASASNYDADLAWIAVGKATIQLYGLILDSLLEQTVPLSESVWYWDDVVSSYANTALYTVQTAPRRLADHAAAVLIDAKEKYRGAAGAREAAEEAQRTVSQRWREFYDLVQSSIRERSLVQARGRILSPFAICRIEARKNQAEIEKLRELNATAIGLIVDECLSFDEPQKKSASPQSADSDSTQWRGRIVKSVSLLETVLRNITNTDPSSPNLVDRARQSMEDDVGVTGASDENASTTAPSELAKRILHVIDDHLSAQELAYTRMSGEFGKPSRLIRYWIPGVALLLSGGTLLRIFANRKAEIMQWIQDLGATVQDFWLNWVVEPTKRLIGTIRHDAESEIAIQSKESLKADRESLERMVVDFAIAHPEKVGTKYTDLEIADIRLKVKEGDLTPVLKAYEREMQSPIKNAVMGDLVRTLLIQVQKTKVDVEVAIGGIDSLLKSQELLFGFVGIAPGVLITYFAVQWLRGTFGGRRGIRQQKQQGEAVRLLRNIDRTLTDSKPSEDGIMSYKDHGLLLCEGHVLRQRAAKVLPGSAQRIFVEDFNDLMNSRLGIQHQQKVLQRIQWTYAQWLR